MTNGFKHGLLFQHFCLELRELLDGQEESLFLQYFGRRANHLEEALAVHEDQQAVRPILVVLLLRQHERVLLQLVFYFLVVLVDGGGLALQSLVHILQVFILEAIPQV